MAAVSESSPPLDCGQLSFQTDQGVAPRAAIGVVVLATDQTLEHELRTLLDVPGVGWFCARIPMVNGVTPQTLADMESHIAETTDLILPGLKLDVVAYGCTSASMVIGERRVFAQIHKVRPGVRCTTPITGVFAAFDALAARRVAVLTPYRDDVNLQVRDYIQGRGYTITAMASFKEEDDNRAGRIRAEDIRDAAIELGKRSDVDMVFVSCTNLRLAAAVREIEDAIGKPVTSSNHAMAWQCLRLAGVSDALPEHGRLFSL